LDLDGDGHPAAIDCDDASPLRFPGAAEACDLVDDDCDGLVDEGAWTHDGPLTHYLGAVPRALAGGPAELFTLHASTIQGALVSDHRDRPQISWPLSADGGAADRRDAGLAIAGDDYFACLGIGPGPAATGPTMSCAHLRPMVAG